MSFKELAMFEVSEEAREMVTEFLQTRKQTSPVRIMVSAGG
jgi:Fe-S cluster assembly iron-binding protein IscA